MPKNNKNKYLFLSAIFFFVAFSFLLVTPANALIADAVSGVIGHVIQFLVYILGGVLFALIYILIWVAKYNDFINAEAVVLGWVIVRDLCNMFFILILLVIAFATILGLENYSIKKNLPKLIIMAILINFSKTICGIFIDFGQVIMLTFVKSFSAMGGGNLTEMLGIKELLKVNVELKDPVELLSVIGSYFLALIYVIIAVVVILVLVAVLVMRMIMMWIYIVLSPLAYLLSTFPAGQKYSQQWWSEFSKNIIVGPLLAFFIWLSFASLGTPGTTAQGILNVTPTGEVPKEVTAIQTEVKTAASTAPIAGASEAGTPNYMIKFIISIGMLMGGLMVTQDLGARAGSAAGKGIAAIQKGKGLATGKAWGGVKLAADSVNRLQGQRTGIDLNPFRGWEGLKSGMATTKKKELDIMQEKASEGLKKGGVKGAFLGLTATGFADKYIGGVLGLTKGVKQMVWGGEKTVQGYRNEAEDAKFKAEHLVNSDSEWGNMHLSYQLEKLAAEGKRDDTAVKAAERNIERLEKFQKELIVPESAKRSEKQKKLQTKASKLEELASKYQILDYEGEKARRSARSEESNKITANNEDELINEFKSAVASNNAPLAEALAIAIAKAHGTNTLLNEYGYQATSGLTKNEMEGIMKRHGPKKADAKAEIDQKKGFNDFMRDIFGGKLKQGEQSYLSLQNDLASIGETTGKNHLVKTVTVEKGRFKQADRAQRERAKLIEKDKMDAETIFRKENRLTLGTEDRDDPSKFIYEDSGLAYLISHLDIAAKEMNLGRFNKSLAKGIAGDAAIKQLRDKCKAAGVTNFVNAATKKEESIEDFIDQLERYAKVSQEETLDKLLSA